MLLQCALGSGVSRAQHEADMFTCDWGVTRAPRLSGWAQGLLGMGRSADLTPVAEYLGAQAWLSAMCVGELAFEPRLSQDLTHCQSSLPRVAVTTALVPTRTVDGRARALYAVWRRGTVEARRELSAHSLQCPLDPFRSVR